MARIRNIIFDWSGTLVDDLPAVWQATNFVFAQSGVAELSLDEFRAQFCLPFKGFYDRHLPHVPMDRLEVLFHGHFRTCQDSVVPLPQAREFLEFCRHRGVRMFLLSSVHPDHFAPQAAVSQFGSFFEKAYLGVMDKRAKVMEILQENGLDADYTVFIGDMQHDIETARHGGIHSCAVLTGYNRLDQLRESDPDLIVEHLGELRRLLEMHDMELKAPVSEHPIVTVGALVKHPADGRWLMIRTHKWSGLWGIPGGKVRAGERCETALVRELAEETALRIGDVCFVLVQDCIHSSEFYREAHFVLLNYTCTCENPDEVVLNEEAEEWRWVTPEEALALPLNTPTRVLLNAVKPAETHG